MVIYSSKKNKHRTLKIRILTHYSHNQKPICACCGETHIEFLTIDHIYCNGNSHRKKIRREIKKGKLKAKSGAPLYRWLEENNFPEGFQVLCSNCNMCRGKNKQRFCCVHHPELYEEQHSP